MANGKILIVDDEPDIAEVVRDRLEANGYDVRVAHSARECYACVAADPPGLILMDIQMPEVSGMEALAEPGEAYLTGRTAHLIEGFFDLDPVGPRDVKGASEPIPVYALRDVGRVRTRTVNNAYHYLPHIH